MPDINNINKFNCKALLLVKKLFNLYYFSLNTTFKSKFLIVFLPIALVIKDYGFIARI